MIVSEEQERAARLKEEIEHACIQHGLNLTIHDGGIGFVDPKENKIVAIWRPQYSRNNEGGGNNDETD